MLLLRSFPYALRYDVGAAVVLWLSSWLENQEVRGLIPGLAATILDIGYLLRPSRDMTEAT